MIHSRSKFINQTKLVLLHQRQCINYIPSQQKHTFTPKKPKPKPSTKPRRKQNPQNHKTIRKTKEPIPFVNDLKEIRDPDEALSLFHRHHQMGSKHSYPSYASLIYKLARARDFDAVETVLGYIQDFNIRCKETLFISLIQHYGKAHLVDKAIEVFNRMTSFDCVRTLQSFNSLLDILVDNDRVDDAKRMFDDAYKMGFRPNLISFNVMIKGRLKKGEWEEASRLFDEMLEREVPPTVVTYNSLIGFLCRKGEMEKAKGLFEDMIKKGTYPNAVTYALLMEGLCFKGEYNEAKKMMFDMAYRGCKPQLVNFGVLMSDLGKRGKIEEAKSLLSEMKKRQYKPDVVTYNILINYLCKEDRAAEAYKVLTEMQIGGCKPNAATYRTMVDGFLRVEDFEGSLKVLNAMLTSRHCPRLETFSCLLVGLLKGGKVDDACFVLEEMEKRKMRFELKAWEGLVTDACIGDGNAGGLNYDLRLDVLVGLLCPEEASKSSHNLIESHSIMTNRKSLCAPLKPLFSLLLLALTITCTSSARILDEDETPVPTTAPVTPGSVVTPAGPSAATSAAAVTNAYTHHPLIFFMHDILGGSNPSARAVTGIVANPAVTGQVAFAKPNGANLPLNNGVPLNNNNNGLVNNNNVPFLTGLSGTTAGVSQNNGNNFPNGGFANIPVLNGGQVPAGSTFQKLMFGTLTVIDDELTEDHELGSGLVGKVQGFYVASSEDGTSQTMAFTAMFESGGYADSISFFGVHRTAVSESQLAIIGGTGKYVNAKGYATVKTFPATNQHNIDGVETLLQLTVFLTY
ncbi:hypothetical protein CUMW_034760 [Citrus unshiu]|nr:hypothetical protein CUMW_034760 [Citrus unshiu]